jgi:WD40 repeat protein
MPHPSPAIDPVAERLVAGSNDGVVYAWEFPSMAFTWEFETGGEVKGTPPVYEGKTYVGSWDGNFYCLDLVDGDELWRFETTDVVMSNPGVDPDSSTVFVGGDDRYVRALDAETGDVRWERNVNHSVIGSLTVTADAVLVGSYDAHLYALEKDTGEVRWRVRCNGHVTSEPVPHGGNIYVAERADIAGYWDDDEETVVKKPGHAYCLTPRE